MPGPPEIDVDEREDHTFSVQVRQGARSYDYEVTVPEGLAARLGHPAVDAAELVRESFTFLLEREPPNSILPRFALDVISRYFPEYDAAMVEKLSGGRPI